VLEDGGRLLIRKTNTGRYVLSQNINGKWYKVEKNNIKVSQLLSSLLSSSAPQHDLSMVVMNNIAYGSSGSALGNFLADLVLTNQPIDVLMAKFVTSSFTGVVIGVIMSEIPFFGLALAGMFGGFGLHGVLSNRMIPGTEKARRIFKGIAMNGANFGLSAAGGIAGAMLIPIPVAGAFIGSLAAGISTSLVYYVFDKFSKAKINIETLIIYLWYTRLSDGTWSFDGLHNNEHVPKDMHDCSVWFLDWLARKISKDTFLTLDEIKREICEKKKTILSILSDIYVSTLPSRFKNKWDAKGLERLWLTSIVFAINSYFYFCIV
jgi:hypothetical protein